LSARSAGLRGASAVDADRNVRLAWVDHALELFAQALVLGLLSAQRDARAFGAIVRHEPTVHVAAAARSDVDPQHSDCAVCLFVPRCAGDAARE
jgi:hypothetical protein